MEIVQNYVESLSKDIQKYYNILSPSGIPDFLYEYIETPRMQKQAGISVSCGTIYSKLFSNKIWYSSLDHSIGVALIIWNFTKDKNQTLAGLFHDIATPVFKHCIDFLNGDYENQESTEDLTEIMIKNSEEIMNLLKRDNIKVEEVANYHIYPIADNDTPKLAADRLEYTLSNGLGVVKDFWSLDEVEEIYNNIAIYKNEDGIEELGFKDRKIAEKFVRTMSKLSKVYIENKNKYSMQFLADIIKKMSKINLISKEDLYNLSEKEVIEKIENCDYDNISNCFKYWKNANKIDESDTLLKDKYCLSLKAKKRYIVPIVENNGEPIRINKISEQANEDINNFLNFETPKYAYLDFKF